LIYVTDVTHKDDIQVFLAVKISNDFIIDIFNNILNGFRSFLRSGSLLGRSGSSSSRSSNLRLRGFGLGFSNDRLGSYYGVG
jgi:hypothetical protein